VRHLLLGSGAVALDAARYVPQLNGL